MEFLAMPWKLWESGDYNQQRLLFKLALPEPMHLFAASEALYQLS